jgi:hypothetical protein
MACDAFRDAIAEKVDGELSPSRSVALNRHLEGCASCAALLADLQRITAVAPSLKILDPPSSIRPQIATARAAATAERRQVVRRYRRLALAASVVAALGIGAWQMRGVFPGLESPIETSGAPDNVGTGAPGGGDDLVQSIEEELRLAAEHYERAIAGLERAAGADQQSLDPAIAATLQKNLGVIDQAIDESRAALRSQPTSQPARESLFEAFKNKVVLLQDTVALINEMRKGDDAGTARMVSELAK